MSGKSLLEFLENRFEENDSVKDEDRDTALKYLTLEEIQQATHQMSPADSSQVRNNNMGFVFTVDEITRLRRFLILGCEDGTYYVSEKELTADNAKHVINMIEEDKGELVLKEAVEISLSGRCPRNSPAIFCVALCARYPTQRLSPERRAYLKKLAYKAFPQVCRIPTHLFEFVQLCEKASPNSTGWGRSHRNAIKQWYFDKNPRDLALAVTKYRERNGWSHLDVLRLAHPKPSKEQTEYNDIFMYVKSDFNAIMERKRKRDDEVIVQGSVKGQQDELSLAMQLLKAVTNLKKTTNVTEAVQLIRQYRLVREHVPTTLLKEAEIWKALLPDMPMTALIRNLATMTKVGLLTDTSDETNMVISKLKNVQALRKARIHPFSALQAFYVYKTGHGFRGRQEWKPVQSIIDTLEKVFYDSFSFVEPTGKRYLIGLDVSGSMQDVIRGSPLQCRVAAAAMCMLHVRTEPQCDIVGFSDELVPIKVTKEMKLEDVLTTVEMIMMGGTDCALPMLWATKNQKQYDVFIVYTDNETWFGVMHPFQALLRYREKMGIHNAKLIVVGMTATKFTIANPNDRGMLDVVGFDSAAPEIMNQFVLEKV